MWPGEKTRDTNGHGQAGVFNNHTGVADFEEHGSSGGPAAFFHDSGMGRTGETHGASARSFPVFSGHTLSSSAHLRIQHGASPVLWGFYGGFITVVSPGMKMCLCQSLSGPLR